MKHRRIAAMAMVVSIVTKYRRKHIKTNFLSHLLSNHKLREIKDCCHTNSGTKGAINAPNRATVDAEPTPNDRITVGSISAVAT